MLSKLLLQNWRAHTRTEIPLSPFTLLVGPNGTGKTSVLEALYLIGQPRLRGTKEFTGPVAPQWICRQGATEPTEAVVWLHNPPQATQAVGLRLSTTSPGIGMTVGEDQEQRGKNLVSPTFERRPTDAARWETMTDEWKTLPERPEFEDEERWDWGRLPAEIQELSSSMKLVLDTQKLAAPSADKGAESRLAQDGAGLASVLMEMKLNRTDEFNALMSHAARVIPILQDIHFDRRERTVKTTFEKRAVERREVMSELLLTFSDAAKLPAHSASEGTLLVLGFLTALFSPSRPQLILMDDIDRALHPRAQRVFAAQLKELRARFGVQIVATTHSPFLVDAFDATEIVVLLRDEETKQIVAHRLSDHPDAERLLDALRTGEFWLARGEKYPKVTPSSAAEP